ncbi:MAG: helix-turn-helix transcriptional regulator [Bacteroidetes bacterium]|nr:helix-turn-helix transcriptional regulator [Bacteroidota bacterium]
MKKEDINERIVMVMDYYKFTPSIFADELGIIRSSMSHIINGRNKPGLEVIQKLLVRFPELNPDWILSGKDEMLKTDDGVLVEDKMQEVKAVETRIPATAFNGEDMNSLYKNIDLFAPPKEEIPIREIFESPIEMVAPTPVVMPVFEPTPPTSVVAPQEVKAIVETPMVIQEAPQIAKVEVAVSTPTLKEIKRITIYYSDNSFQDFVADK